MVVMMNTMKGGLHLKGLDPFFLKKGLHLKEKQPTLPLPQQEKQQIIFNQPNEYCLQQQQQSGQIWC